ncbi:MAG: O-antigen ligase C-terminal domain-containing protein [Nitrosomonadales bacterium]|nr:O-antigen ligase C-terminal domain-containing protein [Nitrosomonadales bacterium]
MLKNALASLRAIRPAHISLFLVGLMWILPFLHTRHEYPLTTFDQEWWSALLGVFALTLLVAKNFWQQPKIPRIAQLPAGLIVILLLQMALHKVAYIDEGLLYILYLLLAALLMLLGARLRACFGLEKVATVLAICLLIGAELSAVAGVVQYYRWNTPLNPLIVMKASSVGVYGNLAQPNHFANYIALGLISLGLLYRQQCLKAGYVAVLAVPLLFVMTLSGSRSPWLYLLLMSGLAWWGSRRDARQRPLLRYSLLLMLGFGLMHLIVKLPFMAGAAGGVDSMQRLFGGADSGGIRLYLWHESWLMLTQSPWLGVGFGQFAWHHFQLLPVLQPNYISGLYNNAHNLVFQIAAEAGIAGLLVLFAPLGVWLHGMRRETLDAVHWWGYAILGVLAIHSLLEFPLWYTYFMVVAAILLGALDETHYCLELRKVGRISLVAILLLGLMTLVQMRSGYQQLKDALAVRPVSGVIDLAEAFQRTREGLVAVHGRSLMSPYAEIFMGALTDINTDHLGVKLELNDRIMRFVPTQPVVYRQAFFLAQNGQIEQAKRLLEQAIWSYPSSVAEHKQLAQLAEKDPAHFSALLEFATQKEQEHRRAVHRQ